MGLGCYHHVVGFVTEGGPQSATKMSAASAMKTGLYCIGLALGSRELGFCLAYGTILQVVPHAYVFQGAQFECNTRRFHRV